MIYEDDLVWLRYDHRWFGRVTLIQGCQAMVAKLERGQDVVPWPFWPAHKLGEGKFIPLEDLELKPGQEEGLLA